MGDLVFFHFSPMNIVPHSFMNKIQHSTCQIGEKNNTNSFVKPMSNGKNDGTIGTNNEETKGKSFYNRPFNILIEFCPHPTSISKKSMGPL